MREGGAVTDGQWIALDAYFPFKPFPVRLRGQFGAIGQLMFIGFLCACKRNRPQGQISFASDAEALQKMGLEGCPLVNDRGEGWTLDEFWTFTGHAKQTKKTARGDVKTVKSSQFERWQHTVERDMAAERQRRWRAQNGRDKQRDTTRYDERDSQRDETVTDIDKDKDISPYPHDGTVTDVVTSTPQGAPPPAPPNGQRRNGTNPRAQRTNPRAGQPAEPERRPAIPDWAGDPEPDGPVIDAGAVAALRNRGNQ